MQPYKKIFLILTILSFVLMISSFSCRKEQPNVLPPETQTGANTFGCLIDGQLFIGGCCAVTGSQPLNVEYWRVSDKLFITAYGRMNVNSNSNRAIQVGINIDSPRQSSTQKFSQASYFPSDIIDGCWNYTAFNDGVCTITKFDTINKIVSGRFEFDGICSGNIYNIVDSTVIKQITQGRFDLKFNILNQ